jgi:hypothetical protein
MSCRICNSIELRTFLDLGFTHLLIASRREQLHEPEIYYPLHAVPIV